jgi:hypothetical protein
LSTYNFYKAANNPPKFTEKFTVKPLVSNKLQTTKKLIVAEECCTEEVKLVVNVTLGKNDTEVVKN